jgi:BirA family biotin operon repressor/biotin-[acetyl-CoA-carboxylase] ligase
LKENLLLLNQELINKKIANSNIIIEVLENIDSTNTYLRNKLSQDKIRVCFAETQSGGRGSRKRRFWYSPFGQNIYMSYSRSLRKDLSELSGLSLVVSMAMLDAIKEIGISDNIMLKWPNDGMYEGHKLMGNIIEAQVGNKGGALVIIGLAINVNMLEDENNNITQKWSSLRKITGKYIDRNNLAVALIHNLNFYLEQFEKYGLRDFIHQWQKIDSLYNKSIKLNDGEFSGIAKGINEEGNLLLELGGGEVKAFPSGEASIVK